MNIRHTLLCAAAFAALLLSANAFASETREINETIDMDGVTKVVVEISSGSISVAGRESGKLDLAVEQRFRNASSSEADDMEKRIQRTIEKRDGVLYVKFRYEREKSSGFFGLFSDGNVSFDTTIQTPKGVALDLRTSGGHIKVTDMTGATEARTSGGHLEFANLAGPVDGHTSGGHIDARNIAANVKLDTSGGHIDIREVTGDVVAKTSGGRIEIRNIEGSLDARTSGGSVFASFDRGLTGDSRLSTSGGSITAKVPRDQSFAVHAETSGGHVSLAHSGSSKGTFKKNKIDADVNGGGPRLELHTSGGSINISDS